MRSDGCDALGLGLQGIARALVCIPPHGQVRAYDPAVGEYRAYGPAERRAGLAQIAAHLPGVDCGSALWPGTGLVPALVGEVSP
ncbi:hypothetical protein [Streptomyces sp. SID12501]|uniref:Uncharacterized protein n=1 Tax=Streptomyces sp. SID12501 TaxID=2706042 RepID=A0A6B3C551_9ACTN|nr:hypothetical protein [Streptomyces sp. SID12501]NEC91789.1 hypothetical protein [Streptomyces sp. SID12501]